MPMCKRVPRRNNLESHRGLARSGPQRKKGRMVEFVLHASLEADTMFVADWTLSRLLLMNDARYPWLVLVPRREGAQEVHELAPADLAVFIGELVRASGGLMRISGGH